MRHRGHRAFDDTPPRRPWREPRCLASASSSYSFWALAVAATFGAGALLLAGNDATARCGAPAAARPTSTAPAYSLHAGGTVRFILRLVEAGHGRQVLLAGDMACRRCLRAAGLDDADAQALVVANPASLLTWRVG